MLWIEEGLVSGSMESGPNLPLTNRDHRRGTCTACGCGHLRARYVVDQRTSLRAPRLPRIKEERRPFTFSVERMSTSRTREGSFWTLEVTETACG